MDNSNGYTVWVIDDQPVRRRGVVEVLKVTGFELRTSSTLEEASMEITRPNSNRANVVLMFNDPRLFKVRNSDVLLNLRGQTAVGLLVDPSIVNDRSTLQVALRQKISLLCVTCTEDELVKAVWQLAKLGRIGVAETPLDADDLMRTMRLTTRENKIMSLVAQGLKNKEIAKTLCLAAGTVKVHLLHVFEKLAVSNRVEAAGVWLSVTKKTSRSLE